MGHFSHAVLQHTAVFLCAGHCGLLQVSSAHCIVTHGSVGKLPRLWSDRVSPDLTSASPCLWRCCLWFSLSLFVLLPISTLLFSVSSFFGCHEPLLKPYCACHCCSVRRQKSNLVGAHNRFRKLLQNPEPGNKRHGHKNQHQVEACRCYSRCQQRGVEPTGSLYCELNMRNVNNTYRHRQAQFTFRIKGCSWSSSSVLGDQ